MPIAYFGSTIHHTDVGGYGIGAGARDCFEEGLWIPICKLMRAGERNEDVWKFILSNVRQPDHMAGDLHAQMASGEVGAQRLSSLCDSYDLDDIEDLADEIIDRSEAATRASIAELSAGEYQADAVLDLADGSRIDIVCSLRVDPDAGEIFVDYAGSSEASPWGINVVRNYTHAYTTFTVRSAAEPRDSQQPRQLGPHQDGCTRGIHRQRSSATARNCPPRGGHVLAQCPAQGPGPGQAGGVHGRGGRARCGPCR